MTTMLGAWAEADLDEIAAYIARDSPRHAARMLARFYAKFERIGLNPHGYRLRPEFGPDRRIATEGRYVILFRILEENVRIDRVVPGERNLFELIYEDDC